MRNSFGKKLPGPGLFLSLMLLLAGCASTHTLPEEDPEKIEVGYGSADPEHVTGAVAKETAGDQKILLKNSAELLRGRAAGVEVYNVPGGGIRVKVRGTNTFLAGTSPLYVVDGFPLHTTNGILYDINPRDIESITVLKDAASTAIYGSRGANGVVLIKTKI